MKLLAFGASTSSTSINRQLANYAASLVPNADVTQLDLRQFDLPLYSEDEESANGIPAAAHDFRKLITEHDALVVSLAEHNGSYSAAFKNLYDWTSRIEIKVWDDKPMLLLATSPGQGGASIVLAAAEATFSRMGAKIVATFSLPSFQDQFAETTGVKDPELAKQLKQAAGQLSNS